MWSSGATFTLHIPDVSNSEYSNETTCLRSIYTWIIFGVIRMGSCTRSPMAVRCESQHSDNHWQTNWNGAIANARISVSWAERTLIWSRWWDEWQHIHSTPILFAKSRDLKNCWNSRQQSTQNVKIEMMHWHWAHRRHAPVERYTYVCQIFSDAKRWHHSNAITKSDYRTRHGRTLATEMDHLESRIWAFATAAATESSLIYN